MDVSLKEIKAFQKTIDRSHFLDDFQAKYADEDRPLPIGYGQTISQPSLVASMTYWLELSGNEKVLEIGTGSGYQTCLLAEFAAEVYSVELVEALSLQAQERLKQLGYNNCHFKVGDGTEGWEEFSPYGRIICASAASEIPKKLVNQLAINGIMIIPIGPPMIQNLYKFTKNEDGELDEEILERVRFVEFKGKYGWD
ncbi:MAG: protein-L-isoaspartate(D-aspartate) O-methyltransferase [Thermotogota bacterium]